MKEKLAKLIDVKSIMTLTLTIVFCVLALTGVISGQEFLTIFTVIVGFYFGTQSRKKEETTTRTGPQQSGETVPEQVAPMTEAVDAAQQNEVHPPDLENENDITVTGFAG